MKLEITQDVLSKYCSDIADKYKIKVGGVNKLVPNLSMSKINLMLNCCLLTLTV